MLKTFHLQLPLSLDDSFELVRKSGDEIVSWGANSVNQEAHYLEWKQSFWSMTGTTMISATLEEKSENETTVTVMIHKPLQMFDPIGICYRVFRKLEKSVQKNFSRLQQQNSSE